MKALRNEKKTFTQPFERPHNRKCSTCETIFLATSEDILALEFKCGECRFKPEQAVREGRIHRGSVIFQKGAWK